MRDFAVALVAARVAVETAEGAADGVVSVKDGVVESDANGERVIAVGDASGPRIET
jgi:hypothetical protein